MSKRPNIVTDHEKAIEAEIQDARAARDREMRVGMDEIEIDATEAEPFIRSYSRGPAKHEVPAEVQAWIEQEDRDQVQHYRRIYKEIAELAPLRDVWVEEFFERITGPRGYSVHAGTRRTIPEGQIPARPARPWRLVW
ncbi:MAG: hypothetical protein GY719_01115 [bacterium]|nr:hypothetical protein [bacterium]